MASKSPHPGSESGEAGTKFGKVVILRHTLADGSWHFDWMIEIPAWREDRRLLTFRCQDRPDQARMGQLFLGEQLPSHRARYLDFEGDLGGGRGEVVRVAVGASADLQWGNEDRCRFEICWGPPANTRIYVGRRVKDRMWRFVL